MAAAEAGGNIRLSIFLDFVFKIPRRNGKSKLTGSDDLKE